MTVVGHVMHVLNRYRSGARDACVNTGKWPGWSLALAESHEPPGLPPRYVELQCHGFTLYQGICP